MHVCADELAAMIDHSHRERGRARVPRPGDIVPNRGSGSNRDDVRRGPVADSPSPTAVDVGGGGLRRSI